MTLTCQVSCIQTHWAGFYGRSESVTRAGVFPHSRGHDIRGAFAQAGQDILVGLVNPDAWGGSLALASGGGISSVCPTFLL